MNSSRSGRKETSEASGTTRSKSSFSATPKKLPQSTSNDDSKNELISDETDSATINSLSTVLAQLSASDCPTLYALMNMIPSMHQGDPSLKWAAKVYARSLSGIDAGIQSHLKSCSLCRLQSKFRPGEKKGLQMVVTDLMTLCANAFPTLENALKQCIIDEKTALLTEMNQLVMDFTFFKDEVPFMLNSIRDDKQVSFDSVRVLTEELQRFKDLKLLRSQILIEIMKKITYQRKLEDDLNAKIPILKSRLTPEVFNDVRQRIQESITASASEIVSLVDEWEVQNGQGLVRLCDNQKLQTLLQRMSISEIWDSTHLSTPDFASVDNQGAKKKPVPKTSPVKTPGSAAKKKDDAPNEEYVNKIEIELQDNYEDFDIDAKPEEEEAMRVVARVRPLVSKETERGDEVTINCLDDGVTVQFMTNAPGRRGVLEPKTLTFSQALDPCLGQRELFKASGVKRLVSYAINGHVCTVFAYGQTGSGKTYTMTGPEGSFSMDGSKLVERDLELERQLPSSLRTIVDNVKYAIFSGRGLIPRAAEYLFACFDRCKRDYPHITFEIQASCLEVYNETVIDLLDSSKVNMNVRQKPPPENGFEVENLTIVPVQTLDDLNRVILTGARNRHIAPTGMNKDSSRSHSLLCIYVKRIERSQLDGVKQKEIEKLGSITFVDLAGSERQRDTELKGLKAMREASNINKSLLTLSNVISILGQEGVNAKHIPYRDSVLTKLLMNGLGGASITTMIANVSPSRKCMEESANTLFFASKAANIVKRSVRVLSDHEKELVELRDEIGRLVRENIKVRKTVDEITNYYAYLQDLLQKSKIPFNDFIFNDDDNDDDDNDEFNEVSNSTES